MRSLDSCNLDGGALSGGRWAVSILPGWNTQAEAPASLPICWASREDFLRQGMAGFGVNRPQPARAGRPGRFRAERPEFPRHMRGILFGTRRSYAIVTNAPGLSQKRLATRVDTHCGKSAASRSYTRRASSNCPNTCSLSFCDLHPGDWSARFFSLSIQRTKYSAEARSRIVPSPT